MLNRGMGMTPALMLVLAVGCVLWMSAGAAAMGGQVPGDDGAPGSNVIAGVPASGLQEADASTDADVLEYGARQADSPSLEEFAGGDDVIYIGGGVLLVVVIVVIVLIIV